jgi:putative spermidine/putrescine transport system substrate-binding protein
MLTRRTGLLGAAAGLAALGASPRRAAAADSLSIGGLSGGIWAESFRNAIIKPFGEQFGVDMKSEEGISAVTLAKVREQKGNPQFDIVFIDRGVSDLGIRDGLFEPVSPTPLTAVPGVTPEAFIKDSSGKIMAVALTYWGIGLTYDTHAIKEAPTSWFDLTNPDYKGKVAVYSPDNSICLPFLVTIAELKGGGPSNMDPAFAMMKKLARDGALFFAGSPQGANLLASGEAGIATLASSNAWELVSKGVPVKFVVPKEGVIGQDIRMHIVDGTKRKDLAEKFINFAVSAPVQTDLSRRLLTAPVNADVKLPPNIDEKLPWGADGSIKNLRLVDGNVILDHRAEWIQRWNEEVTK